MSFHSEFSHFSRDIRSGLQTLQEKVSSLDQCLTRIEEYQTSSSRGVDPMDTSLAPRSDDEDSEEGSDEGDDEEQGNEEEEGDEEKEGDEEEKGDEEAEEEDDDVDN
ncbi:uncharacterized protein LOC131151430 [Malania oleifera]|uniref:uncharacterized protein LOC131151430 n=1 Tax=Malania oleifera TaxID=397392 RepID=UPI0025AE2EFC|nr:uncharacterized protein LOC131151430 [Malania oleifera]